MIIKASRCWWTVCFVTACSGGTGSGGEPHVEHSDAIQEQVDEGAVVFSMVCATCHGESGAGTSRAPALVGEGALPTFDTAESVYQFASTNMPANDPGSLAREQYVAVVAFLLSRNDIELEEPLTVLRAESIWLHR